MPNKTNYDLTVLTAGERLWLWRKIFGMTQRQLAKRAKINHAYYGAMELDRLEISSPLERSLSSQPQLLTLPWTLRLARRRAGVLLDRLAARNKVSMVTILAWERAGDPRLARFWVKWGFTGIARLIK